MRHPGDSGRRGVVRGPVAIDGDNLYLLVGYDDGTWAAVLVMSARGGCGGRGRRIYSHFTYFTLCSSTALWGLVHPHPRLPPQLLQHVLTPALVDYAIIALPTLPRQMCRTEQAVARTSCCVYVQV